MRQGFQGRQGYSGSRCFGKSVRFLIHSRCVLSSRDSDDFVARG